MSCYSRYFEFYANEAKTLNIQVNSFNNATGCKEPINIDPADDIEVELPGSPNNIVLTKVSTPPVVVDNGPLGKIHIDLEAAQTSVMISGPIIVRITKAGKMTMAVATAGVKKSEILNC